MPDDLQTKNNLERIKELIKEMTNVLTERFDPRNGDCILQAMAHGGELLPAKLHFVRVGDQNNPPQHHSVWNDGVTLLDPDGFYLIIVKGGAGIQVTAKNTYDQHEPSFYEDLFEGYRLTRVVTLPIKDGPQTDTGFIALEYEFVG